MKTQPATGPVEKQSKWPLSGQAESVCQGALPSRPRFGSHYTAGLPLSCDIEVTQVEGEVDGPGGESQAALQLGPDTAPSARIPISDPGQTGLQS